MDISKIEERQVRVAMVVLAIAVARYVKHTSKQARGQYCLGLIVIMEGRKKSGPSTIFMALRNFAMLVHNFMGL